VSAGLSAGGRGQGRTARFLVLGAAAIALAALLACCAPVGSASSAPSSGYLGLHLPASFHAFTAGSAWRTPIAANPQVDPQSANMMTRVGTALVAAGQEATFTVQTTAYTAPIHVVDYAASRKVGVQVPLSRVGDDLDPGNDGVCENIPIPEEVWADPGDDGHVVIVDPNLRKAWEFWHFKKVDGVYSAELGGLWDLDSAGFNAPGSPGNWWRNGANGARSAYIGGLIRYEEVFAGEITHAMNIITPVNRQKIEAGTHTREYYSPTAANSDGWVTTAQAWYAESIPEGARVQLDPAFDLDQPFPPFGDRLNATARTIARAMQVYGAYVMDNGAGFGVKAQNLGADGGDWGNLPTPNLYLIPLSAFRVLQVTETPDGTEILF
jgi:hypothetical protein